MGIADMKNGQTRVRKKNRTYRREASTSRLVLERRLVQRLVHAERVERGLNGGDMRGSSEVVLGPDVASSGAVVVVSIVQTWMGWLRRE
jgi:hypothetical protein